ncbi:GNAT family N-acetyltransferase [Flindersiella endophytica]
MTDWRILAGAANHCSFFAASASATAAGGSADFRHGGVVAKEPGGSLMVGFPDVPAGELAAFADEVVGLARREPRPHQVGWWTLDEAAAKTIGAPLLARGFHWGWRPNWMALDPAHLTDHPVPSGLEVKPAESGFEAWLAGSRVGHVSFHQSDHDGRPIGGIYDMGVEPEARRQGVGTALTVAAGRHLARELGCRLVMLNATGLGQPVYARAGFEHLGEAGQTWWLPKHNLDADPPSPAAVRFLEALGTGDLDAAESAHHEEERDLDAIQPCDLTPLGIATRLGQPLSARWLVDHGATLDVAAAWLLGWRDEAAKLLAENPTLARQRTGSWQLSPLHVAAYRGDIEFARMILAADPDASATDSVLHKDPVEWAHLHGHPDVGNLIADWRSSNEGWAPNRPPVSRSQHEKLAAETQLRQASDCS